MRDFFPLYTYRRNKDTGRVELVQIDSRLRQAKAKCLLVLPAPMCRCARCNETIAHPTLCKRCMNRLTRMEG